MVFIVFVIFSGRAAAEKEGVIKGTVAGDGLYRFCNLSGRTAAEKDKEGISKGIVAGDGFVIPSYLGLKIGYFFILVENWRL